MKPMDCTDIHVILSGLIDDEVDAETRYAAERHLVECAACRDLLGETESLNALVADEVASLADPEQLPADFVGAVLSRTAYADPPATAAGWMNWLGWLAAAAALALAVSIWVMDQRQPTPVSPEPSLAFNDDSPMPSVQMTPLFASTVAEDDLVNTAIERIGNDQATDTPGISTPLISSEGRDDARLHRMAPRHARRR